MSVPDDSRQPEAPQEPLLPEVATLDRHDPDLDPDYPDIDSAELAETIVGLPAARMLSILRSQLTDCGLEMGSSVPIEIQDSVLTGVDLTGRRITSLDRVRMERCRLGGADLGEARVRDVVMRECVLDLSAWRGAQLERVAVVGGRIDGADLTGAHLRDVTLADVALTEVTWHDVRAERVDLTGADVSPVQAVMDLHGCTISPSQAMALAVRSARALGLRILVED